MAEILPCFLRLAKDKSIKNQIFSGTSILIEMTEIVEKFRLVEQCADQDIDRVLNDNLVLETEFALLQNGVNKRQNFGLKACIVRGEQNLHAQFAAE